jgi:hypothetical protein
VSDPALLPLRQFDERISLPRQFGAALDDPRDPELTEHTFLNIIRSRVFGILADPVTGDLTNLTRSPKSEERYPCLSPDGRGIAYTGPVPGGVTVFLLDADGGNKRQLVKEVNRFGAVLAIAAGKRQGAVAARLESDEATVWRACQRYRQGGLALLFADGRQGNSGRPQQISPGLGVAGGQALGRLGRR